MTSHGHVTAASEVKGKSSLPEKPVINCRKMSSSDEDHDVTVPCVLITSCDDSFKEEELVKGELDSHHVE